MVITFNQGLRGGRVVELKKIVDEAVKQCPTVQHVLVAHRTDNKVHMGHRDIPLEQVWLPRFGVAYGWRRRGNYWVNWV